MPTMNIGERFIDRPTGVFAAVLTPFDDTGAPDPGLLALHCRRLLASGCDGLSILGTTGEANSLSVDERIGLLEQLVGDGIPARVLLPGTGCCAIPDTIRLTERATSLGVGGVLMLPPFYYKNVSEDGLFGAFAEVIERIGEGRLRIYLYHFPQMSGVPLTTGLIERLLKRYPGTVAGTKDSSGDLANMTAMPRRFPGFDVFTGSDEFLLPLLRSGGAGCITGVCNVAAFLAARVFAGWRKSESEAAEAAQMRLTSVRNAFLAYPLSAALKEVLAGHTGQVRWRNIRPPLLPVAQDAAAALRSALERIGFSLAEVP